MTSHIATDFRQRVLPPRALAGPALFGFVYWLVFLLVLEPDNLLRASRAGHALPLGVEVVRIAAAALLGAAATPALIALTRRFPLLVPNPWRHLSIHLAGNACLAFVLIVTSCFLAAWGFERQVVPSLAEVRYELIANWTLLVFALSAFTAILHVIGVVRRRDETKTPVTEAPAGHAGSVARVQVKTGGRLRFVEQAHIDWVEAQGNYVALYAEHNRQLVRGTLSDFQKELDANRFVRIHRSTIVAIDRIHEMQPLPNGDATLRLRDGRELRVSRRYREELVQKWRGGEPRCDEPAGRVDGKPYS